MANLASIAMLAETDGLFLVDKPAGVSAHDVMKAVKTRFNLVKLGHGGTLDVTASGLFVLLMGHATHFSQKLMNGDSSYAARFRLGRRTDTYDHAGRILAEADASGVTREQLDRALADLRGDIYQAPPPFSAVKRGDRVAYDIVQTAQDDERRERMVHVYRFAVSHFATPVLDADILCAKGASVRSLAETLGQSLGCGAFLESCRRLALGRYRVEEALPFMDVLKLDAMAFKQRIVPTAAAGLQ